MGSFPFPDFGWIPTNQSDGWLKVDAVFAGVPLDPPLQLIVDSGADQSVVTEVVIEKLGVPSDFVWSHRSSEVRGISGDGQPERWVQFDAIALGPGPVTVKPAWPLNVVDLGATRVDGILGNMVWAESMMIFDLNGERIRLGAPVDLIEQYDPQWFAIDPNSRVPVLDLEVDGVRFRAALDTGATYTALSHELAKRLHLQEGPAVKTSGVGGSVAVHSTPCPSFRVGQFELPVQNCVIQHVEAPIPRSVNLGVSALANTILFIDLPNHRIGLAPSRN